MIAGTPAWHSVPFDTLKYGLGGGNQQPVQQPCEPCPIPLQPGFDYAYIKYVMYSGLGSAQYITWSSFIDAIKHFKLFICVY